mmetsp:Transcript_35978/g.73402  ORF Transcript_35978/g.73402 Transcript_35978/m.73402 type:complete len:310 (-) Transcript_35978:68-997(-)
MLTNAVAATVSHCSGVISSSHGNANKPKSRAFRRILYAIALHLLISFVSSYDLDYNHHPLDCHLFFSSCHHNIMMQAVKNNTKQNGNTKTHFIRPVTKRKRKAKLPSGWETTSFHEMYTHFNCSSHAYDDTKSIPSLDQWLSMREQYNQHVDSNTSFSDPIPPLDGYTFKNNERPPFYAKLSPGKGRGIFASRDIQKGELVHDGSNSDVVFPDGPSFRQYVFALPRPMACDVMEWTWTQQFQEGGDYHICLAINISSLMNTGDDEDEVNALPTSSMTAMFYATRDIRKDEEILTDYEIYKTEWGAVGLE